MNRWYLSTLALAVVALTAAQASARVIAPQPVYERLGRADVVVVGKVDSVEEKNVILPDKSEYQIAVVKISDPVLNAKGLTHVRLGIRAGQAPPEGEVLLFLSQKPGENFYTAPLYFDTVVKNAATFEKDLAETKRLAKLLADPDASLKSKDADERLVTAAMLLTRYRTVKEGQTKQVQIDAAQSKLILQAIADADWEMKTQPGQPTAQQTFAKLRLTEKVDQWLPPVDIKDFPDKAREWIKKYGETYRVMKFVSEKKD